MRKNNLKADIVISYISLFITILVTFFLTKYQVKFLGETQYGIISLVNSVIGYISILDLGIGQTITRYIALYNSRGENEKIERLVGHSFKNYLKISFVALIAGIIIVLFSHRIFPNLNQTQAYLFKISFTISLVNIIMQIPGATFNAILTAYKKFQFLRITNIFKTILRAISIIILLKLGFGVVIVFVVDLVLNQAINVINYLAVKYELKIKLSFRNIDDDIKKEIYSYSFFVFLGIITDQIFWKTDAIILGILSNITVVGIYSISSQLVNQFLNICATFSGVFLPNLTEMVAKNRGQEEINEFFTKASRYQFILVAMILLNYIFLGKQFINIWVGHEMQDAYYYGLVIFVSLTVPMFQTTGYQILFAMNKHKVRAVIYLFNAILNIIMSVILFKFYGAFGPALATAIAMIIGNTIIINIYYKRVLELRLFKFFKEVCFKTGIVAIIVAMIFIGLNKIVIDEGLYSFFIKAVISNSIYLVGVFLYTLTKEERNKILGKIVSIKRQNKPC